MANRIQNQAFLHVFLPFLFLVCIVTADSGLGEDSAARRVGFVFEGSFESPDIARKPDNALKTLLVPYYEWDYGIRAFSKEKWEEKGFDWEAFQSVATTVADAIIEKIEPKLVRDDRGIIDYAIVADKDPFLTSILTSSQLLGKFKDSLGDRLHVVLIDRHLVYLFPATGGKIEAYGPALVDEFKATKLPVSLEVFLVDQDGFRVIGELSRDSAVE